ncbi:SEL1-like repeat protein [Massilia sp. PAMC28688]|uniref:tetratricopeptide repeat protein n=1 Tax=Massilia sp. PAMC28688 TaxID=2861283 RepID=UPI001C626C39|nr:SEL1-like repeat protein [Massilia sp. PAMC28688]QYF94976.1 SEL1-like repeat protein [Massilia sp. PAMC28688]
MANREELGIIRGARGGQRDAQLALGRLYLYGSAGLPKSLPTALHWLDRAAEQGSHQACELIGAHIPLELAVQSARPVAQWYERAYDAGVLRAGVVLAQLTFEHQGGTDPARRAKALRALEQAARCGMADASRLYARYQQGGAPRPPAAGAANAAGAGVFASAAAPCPAPVPCAPAAPAPAAAERWPRAAASTGEPPARATAVPAAERAWHADSPDAFLAQALPRARALAAACAGQPLGAIHPGQDGVATLSRCARLLDAGGPGLRQRHGVSEAELHHFWELAAAEHDAHAQLAMGLWQARMHVDGQRIAAGAGAANFKKAIRWLALAGEQGLPQAWYALSRIYIKPEFSQRNVADAQAYLERAAGMGYREAQLECGHNAWRARREQEGNDVKAVYWLQKAAAQGCPQAAAALGKIAPRTASVFAGVAARAPATLATAYPLLSARLRLAALFGLSRAEALLLDIKSADHGHCLVVDIRASYGRCKRRLIAIASAQERRALDDIVQQFGPVDPGPGGPEGNYRQRLYRLKTVLPEAQQCEETEGESFEMAA